MEKVKNLKLPYKVIIIGCILGLIVAGIGGIKNINANKTNEERKAAALKASEEAVEAANKRLAEIKIEYDRLKSELEAKEEECNSIKMGTDGWFENSSKCSNEKFQIKSSMTRLESEDTMIKNRDYTGYYQPVDPMSYQIYYIIGASIAGVALLGAFIIYLVKGKKSY